MVWLARGLPYGMLDHSGRTLSTGWWIDQMEPSVAPPRLITRIAGSFSRIRFGRSTGIQSPLSRARRRRQPRGTPPSPSESIHIRMGAGTLFQMVTP